MKISFKEYRSKSILVEGSDYGIPHIEDLDVEAFIRVIENINEFDGVQKLDGSNLRVGLDESGELYTSREQKGGKRFYRESDFPKNSSFDSFRAAHLVLEKVEDYLKQYLKPGDAMNLEIIFGEQPNTVFYGKDNLNYIAMLEMLPGDDPSITPDQGKIDDLMKVFDNKTFNIKSVFSDTTDGITIIRVPNVTTWKFTVSDKVPKSEIEEIDLDNDLGKLKTFLRTDNEIARKSGRDLTNFEVLKDRTRDLSDEKKSIQDIIMNDYKLPIKEKLLGLIYKQKPSLRGATGDENGAYQGIEGIIFTDPKTLERFKIVDKEVFSAINKFNYQARNGISGRVTTSNPDMPLESRGGIVGESRIRCIQLFSLENAEMPQQTKKVLEKFKLENKEETIVSIVKSLNQLNFQSIKRKFQAIYIAGLNDCEDALDTFKMGNDDYELPLKNGQVIKYTKEIKRRTLLVFAESRRNLIEMLNNIRRCNDMYDLVSMFFGDQIEQMFGEDK